MIKLLDLLYASFKDVSISSIMFISSAILAFGISHHATPRKWSKYLFVEGSMEIFVHIWFKIAQSVLKGFIFGIQICLWKKLTSFWIFYSWVIIAVKNSLIREKDTIFVHLHNVRFDCASECLHNKNGINQQCEFQLILFILIKNIVIYFGVLYAFIY